MVRQLKDQIDLRLHNTLFLLDLLVNSGPISRADLAKASKMSPTSVTRIISDLLDMGLIRETELGSAKLGRKAIMLDIVPSGLYTIGIQLEKQQIQLCLLDFSEKMVDSVVFDYDCEGKTPEDCARLCLEKLYHIALNNHIDLSNVIGIGIGVVGVIDPDSGNVVISPQLGWRNVPAKEAFQRVFEKKVIIDNDVKMKLVGRKRLLNIHPDTDTAILQLGSGVGSAASSKGFVVRGLQNAAGEIGHIIIDHENGMLCECGRYGCLQTHIAISPLIIRARQYDSSISTINEIHKAYDDGKDWAKRIINDSLKHISIALEVVNNMYNPEQTIITGDLAQEFRDLLPIAINMYKENVFVPQIAKNNIIIAEPESKDCVLGSACMARDAFIADFILEKLLVARHANDIENNKIL